MAEPKPTKTAEERQAEQEAAKAQLDALLTQTRPKNAVEGTVSGIGNIFAGAAGAVGVVVVAPFVGAAVGAQSAGIVGGGVGLVGGAVIGVVGGAAVLVGGTVQGIAQVCRGVVATPAAVSEPRRGKWWSDAEGKWVETNLETEAKDLEGVPSDDSDILGNIDDSGPADNKAAGGRGKVKDPYYYDCLEVDPSAETGKIKKQYYLLARKYHPDKNPGDEEAAEKFKDVAEAYQVLSDEQLRAAYDRDGRDALSGDKTQVNDDGTPKVDPALLFAFLFGSDQFHDYVGRLASASSALTGDSTKVTPVDARRLQARRCARLAVKLAERLEVWTVAEQSAVILWKDEARRLSGVSYGSELVHLIGSVYSLGATHFLGSMESGIGMPSIAEWAKARKAKLEKNSAGTKSKMDAVKAAMGAMKVQQKMAAEAQAAKTDEEKQAVAEKYENEMMTGMLQVMWVMTAVDITSTLYETILMVLHDASVDKETLESRAHGLKMLGDIFMDCPTPEREEEIDAKKLYEDAAFAAMVETAQRKDQATFNASIRH